jgi:hypothetical protein
MRRISSGDGLVDSWRSYLTKEKGETAPILSRQTSAAVTGGETAAANGNNTAAAGAAADEKGVEMRPTASVNINANGQADLSMPGVESPYSAARGIAFFGYLVGSSWVLRGALAATVNSTAPSQLVIAFGLIWIVVGFGLMVINNTITMFVLWGQLHLSKQGATAASFVEAASYMVSGYNVGTTLLSFSNSAGDSAANAQMFNWGDDVGADRQGLSACHTMGRR